MRFIDNCPRLVERAKPIYLSTFPPSEFHLSDVEQAQMPSTDDPRVEFRRLMGLFTTGVCVVAVETEDTGIAAMTVNSLVSVSLDPRLVCWSLQNAASQFDIYAAAQQFSVSILGDDQANLARRYAGRGDTLLQPDDFAKSARGLPVIAGALGHLECHRWSEFAAGDHTMMFGEVMGLSSSAQSLPSASPLAFFNGQFCAIQSS